MLDFLGNEERSLGQFSEVSCCRRLVGSGWLAAGSWTGRRASPAHLEGVGWRKPWLRV